jgi:hypothetical protein
MGQVVILLGIRGTLVDIAADAIASETRSVRVGYDRAG